MTRSGKIQREAEKPKDPSLVEENPGSESDKQAEWMRLTEEYDKRIQEAIAALGTGTKNVGVIHVPYFENIVTTLRQWLSQNAQVFSQEERNLQGQFLQFVMKTSEVCKLKLIALRDKGQIAEVYFTVLDYRSYKDMLKDIRGPPETESVGEGSLGGSRVSSHSSRYDPNGTMPWNRSRGRSRRQQLWRSPARSQRSRNYHPNREYESDELLDEMSKYATLPPPWNKEPTQSTRMERLDVSRLVQTAGERTFSGKIEDYIKWRDFFIGTLGDVRCLARHKVNALRRALESLLDTLVDYAPGDFNGYAEIVKSLEKTYGGLFRQMKRYDEYFDHGEKFKYGNIDLFREFCRKVAGYKALLVQSDQKDLFAMPHIYRRLLLPLPGGHIRELQTWLHSSGRQESAPNLLVWAQDRLDRMMTEAEVDRRKPKPKFESNSYTQLTTRNNRQLHPLMVAPPTETSGDDGWEEEPEEYEDSGIEAINVVTTIPENLCLMGCDDFHALAECPRYLQTKPEIRRSLMRCWRCIICYTCLRQGHSSRACKTGISCRHCKSAAHHTLLHTETGVSINLFSLKIDSSVLRPKVILPIIALKLEVEDRTKLVYAMIDSGATISVVSESITFFFKRNETGYKIKQLQIATAGGEVNTKAYRFEGRIRSLESNRVFTMKAMCLGLEDMFKSMEVPDLEKLKNKYEHLKKIPLRTLSSSRVEMLIGNDNVGLITPYEVVVGREGEPVAERCLLGWSLRGPLGKASEERIGIIEDKICEVDMLKKKFEIDRVLKQIEASWEIPDKFEKTYMTRSEKIACNILVSTMKLENDRIRSGILWKEATPPIVPNNKFVAMKRLEALHKHLKDKPNIKELYHKNIHDWIREGVLIRAPERVLTGKVNYLCHFPVTNLEKETTKVRTVVDASAKYKGIALNDFILAGPNLSNDIRRVLTRFRRRAIAIIGDIKSMFTQIELLKEERDYHRLLWNESPNEKVVEYMFTCFTFGNTCSPAVAASAARFLADLAPSTNARAREVVYQSTVVDDSLDSFDSEEEAVKVLKDLQKIYEKGSMKLRKIGTNSMKVLREFPKNEISETIFEALKNEAQQETKALGVAWNPREDKLCFELNISREVKTRREILSELAKIYDPLGLITPVLILLKILIQKSWSLKIDWDESLPGEIISDWIRVAKRIEGKISFERALGQNKQVKKAEVHIFADASEEALGAVAYLRIEYTDNERSSNLIMSRSRVAPLKQISIPRLELQAAVEAAELSELALNALNVQPKDTYFWTDSSDVIAWLNSASRSLKVFVSNRVGLIQRLTWIQNWRWVPTEDNPADLVSRGSSMKVLDASELWKKGPKFLRTDAIPSQPKNKLSEKASKEVRKKAKIMIVQITEKYWNTKLKKFSSWIKFVNACCKIRRRVLKIEGNQNLLKEWEETEMLIIKFLQKEFFKEEIGKLKNEEKLETKHPLVNYGLFLDKGVIRTSGRISLSEHLPFSTKYPILIPNKTHWSTILIRDIHEKELKHMGGIRLLVATVLEKYFIPHLQIQTKRILRKCAICRKRKFTPIVPRWAPLPECRLPQEERSKPFETVAIDCLGPLFVNNQVRKIVAKKLKTPGRPKKDVREISAEKVYILVISCTLYRSTHLELLGQLSMEALMLAIERFVAVRGRPKKIISDNARNFIGASNLLKTAFVKFQPELVQKFPKIEWVFTTPLDPHKNGVVERIVGLTKDYLAKLTLNKSITFEQLRTFIKMVEAGLNNRPLQQHDADEREQEPLTPNHFIQGSKYNSTLPKHVIPNSLESWTRVSNLLDQFWKRFIKQIVPEMNFVYKKSKKPIDYKVGQLVLVQENIDRHAINFPAYPMARIMEVYKGQDDVIRSLKLKFQDKELIRGVSRISPLF